MGGGPANTLSLLELLEHIQSFRETKIPIKFDEWRPGDQKVFVCNIGKAKRMLDWHPEIGVREGVIGLIDWVKANPKLFDWLK